MSAPRRLVVTVDDRQLDVLVQPPGEDGTVQVSVDGQVRQVTDSDGDNFVVRNGTQGSQVRVTLTRDARAESAATPGTTHTLSVRTARQAASEAAQAAAAPDTAGGATIEAPMPGRVVKVLVEPGQNVQASTPLLIVEAMKMENEVCSPVAGVVGQVAVQAGVTVDAGQLLCTVEPASADAG